MTPSPTHLVLIPSYNPGRAVYATVAAATRATTLEAILRMICR